MVRTFERKDQSGQGRFAGTGLADDAKRFPTVKVERHAAHNGAYDPIRAPKSLYQALRTQQGAVRRGWRRA